MSRQYRVNVVFLIATVTSTSVSGVMPTSRAAEPPASQPGAAATPAGPTGNTSVTHHAVEIQGQTLRYTVTAGLMPMVSPSGEPQADMFFVAYTRDGRQGKGRPILFAFNGGPGAASIWLHLAALGPKRVVFGEGGTELPKRLQLVDNEFTWLEFADLVFIDPVGTGFSRVAAGIDAKRFYAMEPDVSIMGQFIRRYVSQNDRWLSPKYVAGESYGSTRAVALAAYLQNEVGMLLDGLVLISSALDFQTLVFDEANDLPYILIVPGYAATAWYHGKLSPELQEQPLATVLARAQRWANQEYRLALAMGDTLRDERREKVIDKYAYYTGLSPSFIRRRDLRVSNTQFMDEILRDEGRIVGIMDGRVTGLPAGRKGFVTDPSLFLTLGPLVATLHDYVSRDLQYRTDRRYEFLSDDVSRQWQWGSAIDGYPRVTETLRQAMSANPQLRVHMACGYYDLNTSYMSQRYTAEHLRLDASIRENLQVTYYEAGHQLYTYIPALERLTRSVRAMVRAGRS